MDVDQTIPTESGIEKRRHPRHEFPAPGSIKFMEHTINCTVNDVSVSGALFTVESSEMNHLDEDFEFEHGMLVSISVSKLSISLANAKVVRIQEHQRGYDVAVQLNEVDPEISVKLIQNKVGGF